MSSLHGSLLDCCDSLYVSHLYYRHIDGHKCLFPQPKRNKNKDDNSHKWQSTKNSEWEYGQGDLKSFSIKKNKFIV